MSTEDSRYGGSDGKTQGQIMICFAFVVSSTITPSPKHLRYLFICLQGHYERIVGEKDAELVIKKKKETETFANCKSLV